MKGCASFPCLIAAAVLLACGGCATLAALAKDAQSTSDTSMTSAPLGVQAAENYQEAHQSRGFRVGYTVRIR